jgi:hypothetical protein
MGIKPAKFGPYFWGTLHLACIGGIDRMALGELVRLFPMILPCASCGEHFAQVLAENPIPDTDDPELLFKWSVDVHNIVNATLDKPSLTYEEAQEVWLTMPQVPVQEKKTQFDFKIVLIIILLAVILALIINNGIN